MNDGPGMLYASEMAAKALQVAPEGSPHATDACRCAMCARKIRRGDIVSPLDLPKSFTDFKFLGSSGVVCGYCKATTAQHVMRALQRCVITQDGVFNLNKDEARVWFWLTPPKPPYVVVLNQAPSMMATFHYFWRTPVTIDADLVQINVDDVIYQVRRPRVVQAIEYGNLIVQAAQSLQVKKGAIKSPFQVLIRDPSLSPSDNSGRINAVALSLAEQDPRCKQAVDFLSTLRPGELIALSGIFKQKPVAPVEPALITNPKVQTEKE